MATTLNTISRQIELSNGTRSNFISVEEVGNKSYRVLNSETGLLDPRLPLKTGDWVQCAKGKVKLVFKQAISANDPRAGKDALTLDHRVVRYIPISSARKEELLGEVAKAEKIKKRSITTIFPANRISKLT